MCHYTTPIIPHKSRIEIEAERGRERGGEIEILVEDRIESCPPVLLFTSPG